jgi:hypothetical protein
MSISNAVPFSTIPGTRLAASNKRPEQLHTTEEVAMDDSDAFDLAFRPAIAILRAKLALLSPTDP